jgi:hypothetical protein
MTSEPLSSLGRRTEVPEANQDGNELAPSRPKFRMVAAAAMLMFIVAGIAALILGILVLGNSMGLGNDAVTNALEQLASSKNDSALPTMARMLRTFLSQYTFVTLIAFASLMALFAFLLRKVVLAGLRD